METPDEGMVLVETYHFENGEWVRRDEWFTQASVDAIFEQQLREEAMGSFGPKWQRVARRELRNRASKSN